MVTFPSKYSAEEIIQRWDEYTSPARFAGNDETMDLIFVSKRKDNQVKLVRKAKSAREPFSCIFQGTIRQRAQGSEIVGYFRKSFIDYGVIAALLALLFYVRLLILERGDSLNTINALLIIALIGSALLLYNTRASKRRYADFIFRITENEIPMFLSRKEKSDIENDQE